MATGSVTLSGTVSGLSSGTKTIGPLTISAATANGNTIEQVLATGAFTQIDIPPKSATTGQPGGPTVTGVFIIPPAGNTVTMQLKGVTGDTGIPLSLTNPSFISLGTTGTGTSFGITTVGAAVTIQLVWV